MHTFLTPEPIVLEIRNAAGDVRVDLADTATTTVEITASTAHPLGFLDDVLRSVGGRGWRGRNPQPDPADLQSEPGSFDQDPIDDPAERVRVDLVDGTAGAPSTLIVDTDQARNGWRTAFSIRITAPLGSGVRAQTQSADAVVTGEADRLELRTASGDVSVDRVSGHAVVQTASGDVSIGSAARTEVRTASGEVTVRESSDDAVLHTTSGNIRVDRPRADVLARTVSGDVRLLDLVAGRVESITVSGDVEIGIHPGSLAAVDLATVSGNTQSDLEITDDLPADGSEAEPDGQAEGAAAALDIRVKTTSGDIRLRRAAVL